MSENEIDSQAFFYTYGFIAGASNFPSQKNDIRVSSRYEDIVHKVYQVLKSLGSSGYCTQYFNTMNLSIDRISIEETSLPEFKSKEEIFSYIRGLYEVNQMLSNGRCITMRLTDGQFRLIEENIEAKPLCTEEGLYEWLKDDELDLLSSIYSGSRFHSEMMYDTYVNSRIQIKNISTTHNKFYFEFAKTREDAVSPFKARASDSGFDLTLLEKESSVGKVDMYSTGIIVKPDVGWYFMLVPRSSIIKSGYMLANGVGVIDRSYRGEVKVPLIKIDESAPNLPLPSRLVQLVPAPIIDFDFNMKDLGDIGKSSRGDKGFGSSDSIVRI